MQMNLLPICNFSTAQIVMQSGIPIDIFLGQCVNAHGDMSELWGFTQLLGRAITGSTPRSTISLEMSGSYTDLVFTMDDVAAGPPLQTKHDNHPMRITSTVRTPEHQRTEEV